MTIPTVDGNSLILIIAVTFTLLTLALAKGYFSNGDSGPVGTLSQKAQASLTLLNSIGILGLLWIVVVLGLRVASSVERFADYVDRQEKTNAGSP